MTKILLKMGGFLFRGGMRGPLLFFTHVRKELLRSLILYEDHSLLFFN